MHIQIVQHSYQVSQWVANELLCTMLSHQPRINIAPAGGSSPVEAYCLLTSYMQDNPFFQHVYFYLEDEVPYRTQPARGAIAEHLQKILFTPWQIAPDHITTLNAENVEHYDLEIQQQGGLDLVLLGVGHDGHLAANLPGSSFDALTHQVAVTPELHNLLAQELGDPHQVPDFFYTMGLKSLLQARKIVVMATGESKADIIQEMVEGPLTEHIPASLLRLHPNCQLIIDQAAAINLTVNQ